MASIMSLLNRLPCRFLRERPIVTRVHCNEESEHLYLGRAAHPKWAAHGFQELSFPSPDMNMKPYGHCRVSSGDQSLNVQREALKVYDPNIIVLEEKVSAASRDGRHKLALLLEVVGKDDQVIVTKLDQLARDTIDMLEI